MSLFDAIAAGDAGSLAAQLSAGALADLPDAEGRTPLALAAESGDAELVRLLLAHDADPKLSDALGETPLLKAAAWGHREAYALLLPFAADDERDLAERILRMAGVEEVPHVPDGVTPGMWRRALAEVGATVSSLLGDDGPMRRLDRALNRDPSGHPRPSPVPPGTRRPSGGG
ncbi:MAG: ankyrin repeat domain-containing protein [Myxococcaceae bacterium]|nr:ankyrin repeat domain-containing protein [Myxococcaceae bacterium]MCI0672247.1 ankyrin repeat domain-containing protein [Myxococcaceae bacterium]